MYEFIDLIKKGENSLQFEDLVGVVRAQLCSLALELVESAK